MIPQRIIQTGRTRDLTPAAKAAVTNLKLLHPDWEYLYFDDEDIRRFIAEAFPQYEAVFYGFPHAIQRIDFFRYLAIYKLGGFYFDLDVFLSAELPPLQEYGCVFPFEELTINRHLRREHDIDWEIGNYAFGSAPKHPFLSAVIENCVRGQREPAWVDPMMAHVPGLFRADFQVLNTTGPGLLTRTLAENPSSTVGLRVLFPEDVRQPANWHLFGSFGIHLMEGSWRSHKSYLHRRLVCLWEAWAQRRLFAKSARRGPVRSLPLAAAPCGGGDPQFAAGAGAYATAAVLKS